MYFCENCGYSLEISKSSKISKENDNRTPIKLIDAIKKGCDTHILYGTLQLKEN